VITPAEPPALVWPTTAVRDSFLEGERAYCLEQGEPIDWLGALWPSAAASAWTGSC
jgi:hypothetical protein